MITINNGSRSMVVTKGTYSQLFKSLGWQIGELNKKEIAPIAKEVKITEEEIKEHAEETTETDAAEVDEENETDGDDIQNTNLEEKPISDMTPDELKAYATQLGIDFTGVKKAKILRQMIREKLS